MRTTRSWHRAIFPGVLLLTLANAAPSAAQPPIAPADNQQLLDGLREILNRGATLYNEGDRNGCYRLFEGALLALKAQVSKQAELTAMIDKGLRDAELQQGTGERAWALRTALIDIRNKLAIDGGKAMGPLETELEKDPQIRDLRKLRSATLDKINQYKTFAAEGANVSPLIRSQIRGYESDLERIDNQLNKRIAELTPRVMEKKEASPQATPPRKPEAKKAVPAKTPASPQREKPEPPKPPPASAEPKTTSTDGTKVRGKVTLDGKPLSGAFIRLTSEVPGTGYTTKTGDAGEYELKDVKPGKYRVSFTATDPAIMIPAAYRNSATTPVTVEVQKDGTFDIQLKK